MTGEAATQQVRMSGLAAMTVDHRSFKKMPIWENGYLQVRSRRNLCRIFPRH
jgi:hypothetical protein